MRTENLASAITSLSFNTVAPVDPDEPLPPPPPSTDPDKPASDTIIGGAGTEGAWGTLVLGIALAILAIIVGGGIMFRYPGLLGMGIGLVVLLALVVLGVYEISGFVADAQQKGIMVIQAL